ncbi:MAG: DUF5655 domain-containing protein [Chloroflexota bacterium]
MSDPSLIKKLQLKPNQSLLILNASEPMLAHLTSSLSDLALSTEANAQFEAVFLFVQFGDELAQWVKTAVSAINKKEGLLWIAYPKKSAKLETDLTRDNNWEAIKNRGWEPVRLISIDKTWSALRFKPSVSSEDLIAAQYAKKKAALRPIYDELMAYANTLGADISLNVRKGYVALHRKKQFALIKPATQTRVDFALKLNPAPNHERLVADSGVGSGSMTHVVILTAVDQIDEDVKSWLKAAYEQSV